MVREIASGKRMRENVKNRVRGGTVFLNCGGAQGLGGEDRQPDWGLSGRMRRKLGSAEVFRVCDQRQSRAHSKGALGREEKKLARGKGLTGRSGSDLRPEFTWKQYIFPQKYGGAGRYERIGFQRIDTREDLALSAQELEKRCDRWERNRICQPHRSKSGGHPLLVLVTRGGSDRMKGREKKWKGKKRQREKRSVWSGGPNVRCQASVTPEGAILC